MHSCLYIAPILLAGMLFLFQDVLSKQLAHYRAKGTTCFNICICNEQLITVKWTIHSMGVYTEIVCQSASEWQHNMYETISLYMIYLFSGKKVR